MIIHAVLGNPNHPEYGVATIPFPIPHDQYAHCIYEADLEDIQQSQERIWTAAEKIVSSLAALK